MMVSWKGTQNLLKQASVNISPLSTEIPALPADWLFCSHLAELLQLPAEPERGEEGVLAGERN